MAADPHGCCASYRDHLLSVHVGAGALPTRRPDVNRIDRTEAGWDADHAAYRRLRRDGTQPKKIDGAARVEALADHALEVEQSTLLRDVT